MVKNIFLIWWRELSFLHQFPHQFIMLSFSSVSLPPFYYHIFFLFLSFHLSISICCFYSFYYGLSQLFYPLSLTIHHHFYYFFFFLHIFPHSPPNMHPPPPFPVFQSGVTSGMSSSKIPVTASGIANIIPRPFVACDGWHTVACNYVI